MLSNQRVKQFGLCVLLCLPRKTNGFGGNGHQLVKYVRQRCKEQKVSIYPKTNKLLRSKIEQIRKAFFKDCDFLNNNAALPNIQKGCRLRGIKQRPKWFLFFV